MTEIYPRDLTYEHERAIAGSILIDAQCLPDVSSLVKPSDFLYAHPRAVYEAAATLSLSGGKIDPYTIQEEAAKLGVDIPSEYMRDAMDCTPTAANAGEYAKLVRKASQLRGLRSHLQEIANSIGAYSDPSDIASKAYNSLDEVLAGNASSGLVNSTEAVTHWYNLRCEADASDRPSAIKTGFQTLDKQLGGGMINGGLYIIGARPGMGKTTLGLNIADNIAKSHGQVLFVSIEMPKTEITAKRVARESGIPYQKALFGKMDNDDHKRVGSALTTLCETPLTLLDRAVVTVRDISLAARSIKNLQAICIDYLSLIEPGSSSRSRYEEMTGISNDLKRMAKTLKVPVLCLAQLNRENESRRDKRPFLSDLRETGAIEQDADAVIFIHRDAYYDHDHDEANSWDPEELEIIIAKNRHGSTGSVEMSWYGSTGRIFEVRKKGQGYGD